MKPQQMEHILRNVIDRYEAEKVSIKKLTRGMLGASKIQKRAYNGDGLQTMLR